MFKTAILDRFAKDHKDCKINPYPGLGTDSKGEIQNEVLDTFSCPRKGYMGADNRGI